MSIQSTMSRETAAGRKAMIVEALRRARRRFSVQGEVTPSPLSQDETNNDTPTQGKSSDQNHIVEPDARRTLDLLPDTIDGGRP